MNVAGLIWNHALALQRWSYRLTGKHISPGRMKQHIAKLRMKSTRLAGSAGGVRATRKSRRAFLQQARRPPTLPTLCFEDLNLDGMKRLWGRKVSDLGFAQFMSILE